MGIQPMGSKEKRAMNRNAIIFGEKTDVECFM
jgi:hypothetical protein